MFQVGTLLLAVALGNILLFWPHTSRIGRVSHRKLGFSLVIIVFIFATIFSGWEIYWNRSEAVMLGVLLFLPVQALVVATLFFCWNRRTKSPAGWGRLIAGNFLVLVVLLTFVLAAGEIYVRYFYDTTDSFGYTKVSQRWLVRHYQRNKAMFRDNIEYAVTKETGKRRVTFVGDSFTAGHGIANIEDRFSNRLRRLHPDWEVHVLANNGWDTGAERGALESYLSQGYQFDVVVLVYCLNDINDLQSAFGETVQAMSRELSNRPKFLDDSYFLDLLYHRIVVARISWIKNYFSTVQEGYRGEIWNQQKQRLGGLRELVKTNGGQLCVVTFPFLNAIGTQYEYRFIHDQLDAFWREQGVPHLDLLPTLEEYRPRQVTVNRFDAHPNEYANELAAAKMNEFLVDQMKTNAQPASRFRPSF